MGIIGGEVNQSLNIRLCELRHTPLHSRLLNDGDDGGGKRFKSVLSLSTTAMFSSGIQIKEKLLEILRIEPETTSCKPNTIPLSHGDYAKVISRV